MKSVGIKLLKNNLSRYLDLVRKGELVYVTDRDEIIAEIHKPTTPLSPKLSRWEVFMNEQERTGGIRRAKRVKSSVLSNLEKDTSPEITIDWQAILSQTRGDRF